MIKNRCENRLCIYFEDRICMLDTISLGPSGMCEDAILVEVSDAVLSQERTQLRKILEQMEFEMSQTDTSGEDGI